ncbi:MAG: haloacid dehalogenase-like hydrolase [Clostridia bacterium]|nr:haloacid dehalogenase-like hydrolase [Clostridia bacterium]
MNVYDFDNTIYNGESAIDFFVYFLKRDPKLLLYVPKVVRALARYKMRRISIDEALSEYGTLVEEYCRSIENLDEHIRIFWDKNIRKIKPFYYGIRNDDDVILSAGFDVVLAEMGRRMNIKNIVATETDRENFRIVNFCFRENKVKAFKKHYPDAVIENFYTDSLNDQPIIDLAENAYLVKGNKITKIK